jgi:hypothetical protein
MIPQKQKPCNGTGKAIGFKGCKNLSFKRTNGLCDSCLYDFYTTDERGKIIFQKRKIQIKSKNDKEEKAVLKDKVKTLSQFEAEAKKSFQKWIRLRDKDLPCVSCGSTESDTFDGGHFKKAEIYSGVIFDERNVNKQCRRCNRFLNGNELLYREGLIKRFGEDFVKELEQYANETRQYKWTKEQLIAKKLQYDLKIKEFLK